MRSVIVNAVLCAAAVLPTLPSAHAGLVYSLDGPMQGAASPLCVPFTSTANQSTGPFDILIVRPEEDFCGVSCDNAEACPVSLLLSEFSTTLSLLAEDKY